MAIKPGERTYPLTLKSVPAYSINAGVVSAYDYAGDPKNGFAGGGGAPHVGSKTFSAVNGTPSTLQVAAGIWGRDFSIGKTATAQYGGLHTKELGFGSADGKAGFTLYRRYRTPSTSAQVTALPIASYRDASAACIVLYMQQHADGYNYFYFSLKGGYSLPVSTLRTSEPSLRVAPSTVVDLYLTFDGTTASFYLNGAPVASLSTPDFFCYNTQWSGVSAKDGPGAGPLDLVAIDHTIWNRALSAAEVAFHYSDPYGGYVNTAPVANGVRITGPVPNAIVNSDGFTVSGTYAGAAPTAIQARFKGGAWTTIASAPTGGVFSGTMPAQPTGNGLLEVRYANSTSTTASTTVTARMPLPSIGIAIQSAPDGQTISFDLVIQRTASLNINLIPTSSGAVSKSITIPTGNSFSPANITATLEAIEAGSYAVNVTGSNESGNTVISGMPFTILGIEGGGYLATSASPEPLPNPDPQPNTKIYMAIADRVKDSTTTTGTGPFALSGTPDRNFRPFLTPPIQIGSRVPYAASHRTLDEWEDGFAVLTAELVLERVEVTASSNNNELVNFSEGIKDITCDSTAAFFDTLAGAHSIMTAAISPDPTATEFMVMQGGVPKRISVSNAGVKFDQMPVIPQPYVDTDEIEGYRAGFGDGRMTLSGILSYIESKITTAPADTTAPVLSAPAGAQTGSTTANGSVTTNEASGTVYCLVSAGSTATATAVKASALSQAVTSTGAKTFNITGLTASTQYYLHFVHRDAAGNDSVVASSAAFTTAATADVTAPALSSPGATVTGSTTATGTVTTNEAGGTLYCLASVGATTTAATVKGSSNTLAVATSGAKNFSLTGLSPATQYYLHFLHRDASGNESAIVTSAAFTTQPASDTTAPVLSSPTGTQTGSTTASGSVSTNEANGTLYRLASVNATESAATIQAASLIQSVTATGVQNVTFTGLQAGTQYYAHYVHVDAAGNVSAVAKSAAFTTAAAAPLSINTPSTQQAGVYFTLTGTYTGTAPTALDYSSDGGTNWVQATATIGSGAWSFTMYLQNENAAQVVQVRDRGVPTNIATSAPFAVSAPIAYAITGYTTNGTVNAVKDTYDASATTVNSVDKKTLRSGLFINGNTYLSFSPNPASAVSGWSNSPTVPPAILADPATNTAANQGRLNGAIPMAKPAAWSSESYLNLTVGTGSSRWYLWVKPVDGVWQCFNPSGILVTGA